VKILAKLIAILALVSLSQVALAADPAAKKPEMKMDHPMAKMDHPMAKMDESKMMEHLKMRQEQILKMHDLSSKILAETDPAKQQALKDQQLELIKAEHMQMMNMHHPKMMK